MPIANLQILIIDNDRNIRDKYNNHLKFENNNLVFIENKKDLNRILKNGYFDLVIYDYDFKNLFQLASAHDSVGQYLAARVFNRTARRQPACQACNLDTHRPKQRT